MTQPEISVTVRLTPYFLETPQQMLNALIALMPFGYWGSVRYSDSITGANEWDMDLSRPGNQSVQVKIGQVIIKYSNSDAIEVLSAADYAGKYGE